jgi:paxillin
VLQIDSKYFDKNGQPQCPKCEREGHDQCAGCHKAFAAEEANVKALDKRWHTQCFFCAGCGKKFAQATSVEDRKFREKNGRPYCEQCFSK